MTKAKIQLKVWKLGATLDPFQECLVSQSFDDYKPLLNCVPADVRSLQTEFEQYLLEVSPQNTSIDLIVYSHKAIAGYPSLANTALAFLCIANGSYDVERTFSQLRHVQRLDRSMMDTEMLRIEMIMYINKDFW